MEIVGRVEGSEEGKIEDNTAVKLGSVSAPLNEVADPVVYKLVRVDFDGRLVPATDDELMEVENLLEFEEEVVSVSDVMETVGKDLNKDDTSEKPLLKKLKGSSEGKIAGADREKLEVRLEETSATTSSNINNRQTNLSGNGEESSHKDALNKRESVGLKPDFSLLKSEINLDKLTIRELQETFRATFGRETSVKDKLWLKRRIAMGLTNSCDVSVTSFIIKDGNFLKNEEEMSKNMDCEDTVVGEVCSAGDDIPVVCQNVMEDTVDDTEVRNSFMESDRGGEDVVEQKGDKRVRKPTKRYIEELSDKEARDCSGKLIPAAKHFEHHKTSSRLPVRTAWGANAGAIVTRPDSIGGSGVQVPYVSRIRRCRPRRSVISLTKFKTSEIAVTRKTAESSVTVSNAPLDDLSEDKAVVVKSFPCKELIASEEEKEKRCSTGISDVSEDKEPPDVNSRGDADTSQENVVGINSDDNLATVPTSKGGMRRKHHRAWTLTEVVKLVDGVSKFGAGRWSEIKRLSFSSYSYRTSVDLKDKWRNLLKASFANPPSEKGMIPRKNIPSPIPAPILVKVRELAEINGQAPRSVKASSENSGSSVNENRSGYL